MKVLTIVGARPQFIKAAALSRILIKSCTEILVHTGQHYDHNMSDVFFDELDIPKPDYNIGVGSASHAKQTADMLVGIEEIILKEKPDYVLVYGDTNSTLAGSLTAAKLLVPIVHIEAGLRSFNMNMPEEQNRVLTDHLSKYLFCPTDTAVENLYHEGIKDNIYNVGDVMCDAVLYYSKGVNAKGHDFYVNQLHNIFSNEIENIDKWYLTTIHRAENTDTICRLDEILKALECLKYKVIFPVHPRIKNYIISLYEKYKYNNILFVEPLSYIEMLYFAKNAVKILTDSGGLQKEAYIMNVPCVTIREQTEWIETLNGNHNILAKPLMDDIIEKVNNTKIVEATHRQYYGDGNAAAKIVEILMKEGNSI